MATSYSAQQHEDGFRASGTARWEVIATERRRRVGASTLTSEFVVDDNGHILSGEKATWPQLDVIERNTKISENLRYYLSQLKLREAKELGHAS